MPPESNASTPAQIGRDLCDQLFAAEKEIQSLPPEQRQEKRLAVEQPMLRAFWWWLDELSTQPLAGSLKKAVEYAQGQRSYMENYLKDPRCEMSIVERCATPIIAVTSIPPLIMKLSRYSDCASLSRKRSII